jgi:hypothetical protein
MVSIRLQNLLYFFFLLSAFGALFISGWWPLEKQGIGGGHNYVDLKAVLDVAQCYLTEGKTVFSEGSICSYQYGVFLLDFINVLGLTSINYKLLGFTLFFFSAIFLSFVATSTSYSSRSRFLSALLVLSTGSWLLFERGNFDSLIFLIVLASLLFLDTKYSLVGFALIGTTALMKFYTLPLLFLFVVLEKKRGTKIFGVLITLIIVFRIIPDITAASSHPNPLFAAFGVSAPALWVNFLSWKFELGITLGIEIQYLLGYVILLTVISLIKLTALGKRFQIKYEDKEGKWREKVFLMSSGVFLSCFLAGMNYDYRLIYLSIALVMLNAANPKLITNKIFISLELSALWFTYFFFGITGPIQVILAFIGHLSQLLLASILILTTFDYLKTKVDFRL